MKKSWNISSLFLIVVLGTFASSCMSIKFSPDKAAFHPQGPALENIDIVLVLGGGGARGVAHVGVLEELLKAGITPNLIIGSSAGAMVGALYADTLDIAYVKETVLNTRLKHILDGYFWYLPASKANGKAMDQYLAKKLKSRNFEDLKMPFIAVATNLQFGDITAFGSGPLLPAIRASAACPAAYYPVEIAGQYFVDGAVAAPVPVSVARPFNPKIIISVDIKEELTESKPNNIVEFFNRCLAISLMSHSDLSTETADVVIKFAFHDIGVFNDEKNEYLYQEGRKETLKKIDDIKKLISLKIK